MHFSTVTIDQTSVFITFLVVVLLIVLTVLRYKRMVVCKHKYVLFKIVNLVEFEGATPHGAKYVTRCNRCGKIKIFRR